MAKQQPHKTETETEVKSESLAAELTVHDPVTGEIALRQAGGALSVSDDPFADAAGDGLENVGARDLLVPRVTILQALSPQLNPKKPEYIKGAELGMICDCATGEIIEGPMLFLPVYYKKKWVEWLPAGSGKRPPVEEHETDAIMELCKMAGPKGVTPTLPNGNTIVETAMFYGLNLSAGNRRSFLPMASTQLKRAKKWLTLSTSEREKRADGTTYVPPLYFRAYELSTVTESDGTNDWGGWKVERGKKLSETGADWRETLAEAQAFRDSIKRGDLKGDMSEGNDAGPAADRRGDDAEM